MKIDTSGPTVARKTNSFRMGKRFRQVWQGCTFLATVCARLMSQLLFFVGHASTGWWEWRHTSGPTVARKTNSFRMGKRFRQVWQGCTFLATVCARLMSQLLFFVGHASTGWWEWRHTSLQSCGRVCVCVCVCVCVGGGGGLHLARLFGRKFYEDGTLFFIWGGGGHSPPFVGEMRTYIANLVRSVHVTKDSWNVMPLDVYSHTLSPYMANLDYIRHSHGFEKGIKTPFHQLSNLLHKYRDREDIHCEYNVCHSSSCFNIRWLHGRHNSCGVM